LGATEVIDEHNEKIELCSYEVYPGNLETPPEHCDKEADGGDYCPEHARKIAELEALVEKTLGEQ
jgi:hypothetical protein